MYRLDTDLKVNEQYKCFTNFNVHANHMVQFSLLHQSCPTLCSPPGFPVLHLASGVCWNSCPLSQWWPSAIIFCHPVLLPSIFHSIRIFSSGLALKHAGLVAPWDIWNITSPTRDQTHVPCNVRWILSHWTTRRVPKLAFKRSNTSTWYTIWKAQMNNKTESPLEKTNYYFLKCFFSKAFYTFRNMDIYAFIMSLY